MICGNCGSEVNRSLTVVKNGAVINGCHLCIHLTPLYPNNLHALGCNSKMSVAHREDIKHRKLDPVTKEVYRDYSRKYL